MRLEEIAAPRPTGDIAPHKNLERMIGMAIIDAQFSSRLLHSPVVAAAEFNLSAEELDVLDSANAESLEDLAAYVHSWIARTPRPRRPNSGRLVTDRYELRRVAV